MAGANRLKVMGPACCATLAILAQRSYDVQRLVEHGAEQRTSIALVEQARDLRPGERLPLGGAALSEVQAGDQQHVNRRRKDCGRTD
jgi:hypothetical protein